VIFLFDKLISSLFVFHSAVYTILRNCHVMQQVHAQTVLQT